MQASHERRLNAGSMEQNETGEAEIYSFYSASLSVCLHNTTALKMIKIMLRLSPDLKVNASHDVKMWWVEDWRSLIFGPSTYSADWGPQARPHNRKARQPEGRARISVSTVTSCHAMLIPGGGGKMIFYVCHPYCKVRRRSCQPLSPWQMVGYLTSPTQSDGL